MKIRNKMVLIMTMMTMTAVFGVIAGIVTIFHSRVEEEKAELNSKLVQQMLFHFELLTDEMEYDLFERVLSEGVPGMMLMKADDARRFNLHSKLSAISRHNDYTTELFVVDNANEIFSSSVDETLLVHIDELIKEGFFTSEKGSSWLRDGEGNVFFRRNLNNIYPYESAGELIALVDQNAFWSAMGLNVTKATQLIFYDNDGKPILVSDENVMTSDNLPGYIIFSSGKEDEWHARSFVKRSEALGTVYKATRMGAVMSVIVVICAAALSVLISRAITRNIDTLVQATNSLGSGVFGEEIPVRSHDEIGHLTVHFNRMSQDIKRLNEQMVQETKARERARYEMLEMKYRSLQSKVSPHFICNLLATVDSLAITGEVDKMERLSAMAGSYLRTNLRNNNRKFLPLREEMDTLCAYVELYRGIFETDFFFDAQKEEELGEVPVPAFILQPMVENSLKHGIRGMNGHQLCIRVTARRKGDRLMIEVEDNGAGISEGVISRLGEGEEMGFGLNSIMHRMELLYGKQAQVEVTSVPYEHTCIRLLLPLCMGNKDND